MSHQNLTGFMWSSIGYRKDPFSNLKLYPPWGISFVHLKLKRIFKILLLLLSLLLLSLFFVIFIQVLRGDIVNGYGAQVVYLIEPWRPPWVKGFVGVGFRLWGLGFGVWG